MPKHGAFEFEMIRADSIPMQVQSRWRRFLRTSVHDSGQRLTFSNIESKPSNILIFDQKFSTKNLVKNYNFDYKKLQIFGETLIFWSKSKFWSNVEIFMKNRNICQKSKLLMKNRNICQIFKLLTKNRNICQIFKFWLKIEIVDNNPNFFQKSKLWSKIEIVDQQFIKISLLYCRFRPKMEIFWKIEIFVKNRNSSYKVSHGSEKSPQEKLYLEGV